MICKLSRLLPLLARHGSALLAASILAGLALVLLVLAFGVMDGVQARLLADPLWVLAALGLAQAGNLALNALTALALWPLGQRVALAAGMLAGNRNQALFLAVLPAAADPEVLIFFAIGQVPMFLSPFLLKPVYRRLARR